MLRVKACRQQYGIKHSSTDWPPLIQRALQTELVSRDRLAKLREDALFCAQQWAAKVSHQSESTVPRSLDQDLWTLWLGDDSLLWHFMGACPRGWYTCLLTSTLRVNHSFLSILYKIALASLLLEWEWDWLATWSSPSFKKITKLSGL